MNTDGIYILRRLTGELIARELQWPPPGNLRLGEAVGGAVFSLDRKIDLQGHVRIALYREILSGKASCPLCGCMRLGTISLDGAVRRKCSGCGAILREGARTATG
jgi:hypothetical protein